MASSLAFAGVSGGILWLDGVNERWRADNKFTFIGPHIAFDKTPDGMSVTAVQIGLILQNSAPFRMSYKVSKMRTTADDTNPNIRVMHNMGSTIQPFISEIFRDRPINLKVPKAAMSATLEFELVYGREGREKYSLQRSINIELRYDQATGVLHHPWLDAPRNS